MGKAAPALDLAQEESKFDPKKDCSDRENSNTDKDGNKIKRKRCKRSRSVQTISVITYVKIKNWDGKVKKIEKTRHIRSLSRLRFKEWCEKQRNRIVLKAVPEKCSEADSWANMSAKINNVEQNTGSEELYGIKDKSADELIMLKFRSNNSQKIVNQDSSIEKMGAQRC